MDKPLVSVLMTAYNREKYIAEAIESVRASTFQNFELIVVDDGSTDRSNEIALAYAKRDSRIRVYRNEENLTDYHNRNRAAELAHGQYLKYLDSDDMLYPHGLEVMVDSMAKFPQAVLGLCRPDSQQGPYPIQLSPHEAYREHFLLETGLLSYGPSFAIIRTAAFRAAGGFSGKRFVGDFELWLELAARFPVVKMVMGLVWYRIHAGQELSVQFTTTEPVHWCYDVLTKAASDPRGLLHAAEQRQALRRLKHLHARNIFSLARRGYRRVAWELYRQSSLSLLDMARGLRLPATRVVRRHAVPQGEQQT